MQEAPSASSADPVKTEGAGDSDLLAKIESLMAQLDVEKKASAEYLKSCETMEKLVNDRDRQARSDRKQIEHFEQESRRQRMENKELL